MSFLNLQKDMILLMLLEHPGSKLLVCVTLVSGEQYSTFVAGVRPQRLPSHVSYCRAALHSCATQSSATQLCYTVQLHCYHSWTKLSWSETCFTNGRGSNHPKMFHANIEPFLKTNACNLCYTVHWS